MLQLKFRPSYLLIACLFLLFLIAVNTAAFAQDKTFSISGIVLDNKQQPVPGASITIMNTADRQMLYKTITNDKGSYAFKCNAIHIEILVSYVGYAAYKGKPLLISKNLAIDPIVLQEDNKLKEVTIKGEATPPLIQASGGKIIFNVANSVTSQGSNVFDVLKKAPGVMVNSDNTIDIAGREGSLVMLNGKQTYLQPAELADLLKSMSAANIKSIEVINNPSAQYDAAGSGGIINIVLRKK